jgi:hypothetical protein
MLLKTTLIIHVAFALVGFMSGFLAMVFRKGSGLHGAAGSVFFSSMVIASSTGICVAGFLRPNHGNLMGSMLVLYLITTAWVAAKYRDGKVGHFDRAALVFALAIAAAGVTWGFQARGHSAVAREYPAPFFFAFGAIALLFALSDIRMLVRGGVFGTKRIARHLWRMSMALLFTSLSSQGRLLPPSLGKTSLAYAPTFFVIGSMLFWLYRVSVRKRVPQEKATGARPALGRVVNARVVNARVVNAGAAV